MKTKRNRENCGSRSINLAPFRCFAAYFKACDPLKTLRHGFISLVSFTSSSHGKCRHFSCAGFSISHNVQYTTDHAQKTEKRLFQGVFFMYGQNIRPDKRTPRTAQK